MCGDSEKKRKGNDDERPAIGLGSFSMKRKKSNKGEKEKYHMKDE